MVPETGEGNPPTRESLKTHRTDWKDKLRQNCLRRIREERAHLLWKIRSNEKQPVDKKEIVESAFRDIVSDELQKIKQSPFCDCQESSVSKNDDLLWEYDGLHADNSIEIESEDILIAMERLLYDELREEMIRRELEDQEEEDEFLARAVFEQMQLDNNQKGEKRENKEEEEQSFFFVSFKCREVSVTWNKSMAKALALFVFHFYIFFSPSNHAWENKSLIAPLSQFSISHQVGKNDKVWCPICKRGELREAYHLIYCTSCDLRLDLENDKVNLELLRDRLGEVHIEHLERGCKVTPTFCMETVFDLTALYIQCAVCDTFEVVI